MSIYTARLLKGNQRPSPLFVEKGLEKLQPCALGNSDVRGFPHKRQIAYGSYIQYLSAFLFATEKGVRVSTSLEGFPIALQSAQMITDLNPPPLGVSFEKKPNRDLIDAFENEHGVRSIHNAGQAIFIFDKPSPDLAKKLVIEKAVVNSRNPGGVSTLIGYQSWQFCWKLVTLFCATHTYPAFSTPLSDQTTIHNYSHDVEISIPPTLGKADNKRRKIIPLVGEDDHMDEDEELDTSNDLPRLTTLEDIVLVAKPAPFYPRVNFGPVASVPNLAGLVFPYFHQLITPDYQLLPSIMWRFFLQSFGSDRTAFLRGFERWKLGAKSWTESVCGLELQHIFFGISLALDTQTRVFFVVEHETYQGFVLLGEGFSVVAQDREHMPVDAASLRDHLARISPHDNALSELCTMLSNATLAGSKKRKKVERTHITCNRQLYIEVHQRQFSEDERTTMIKLACELSFAERYWKVSPETLDVFLDVYCNRDGVHKNTEPMYIGSGLLFEKDQAYLALSVFGPTAPSFFTIGGEKKEIPATGRPDPLSVIDSSTKKPVLPFIPYTMKSIRTAMQDLYKVYKDKALYVLPKERAGPSRTTQFTGRARDRVWGILKEHIGDREEFDTEKKVVPTADIVDVSGAAIVSFGDELEFD